MPLCNLFARIYRWINNQRLNLRSVNSKFIYVEPWKLLVNSELKRNYLDYGDQSLDTVIKKTVNND